MVLVAVVDHPQTWDIHFRYYFEPFQCQSKCLFTVFSVRLAAWQREVLLMFQEEIASLISALQLLSGTAVRSMNLI